MDDDQEIELTPEMIEAGSEMVWRLRGFDPNFVAERVYRAMAEARKPAPAGET